MTENKFLQEDLMAVALFMHRGAIIDGVMPTPLHIHWMEKAILPVMGDL